jgi:hypothetical protein
MSDDHEVRELRFKLKQANRTMGKQGQTIHDLRAHNALIREESSKVARGDVRRLEREVEQLKEINAKQGKRNQELREKLAEKGVDEPQEGDAYSGQAEPESGSVVAW